MEKIFKKSLALILSAALCLTALVGCLTVSAAEGDTTKPVYSVNSVEGAAGAEVDVVASFSKISNVCAHHVIFTFPAGLEVTAVKNAAGEPYAAFDNSGERFDYKLDRAEDGSTKVQFLDFVNWAAEGLSTSDMSIHFTVKIAAGAAANTEYPVTIAVQAADYAAENLLDVTCTSGKVTVKADTHEHTWDAGVMTTMPTTTSNGVVTYTCTECQETKTEDFVVAGTVTEYSNYTFVNVAEAKTQYAVKISPEVFSSIIANKCELVEYGVMLTLDGTTPAADNEKTQVFPNASITEAPAKSKSDALYYSGMNLDQMGWTTSFRPYVKFTRAGQTCYFYAENYSKVFIEAIKDNTDAQSIALLALYNGKAAATDITELCAGTPVDSGNSGFSARSNFTQFEMKAAKVQDATYIDVSVFEAIVNNGGTLIEYGEMLTTNGSIPDSANTATQIWATKPINSVPAKRVTSALYYTGMNIEQMGSTLSFRSYVKYTTANGETAYVYGTTNTYKLIDILNNYTETNSYAADLVNYYNTYIVK